MLEDNGYFPSILTEKPPMQRNTAWRKALEQFELVVES
jgi:hypothetical protein